MQQSVTILNIVVNSYNFQVTKSKDCLKSVESTVERMEEKFDVAVCEKSTDEQAKVMICWNV
ncbi:hypothetical protein T06_10113 [Trichinella sp. T6]|nr:hypothetical protein T06_10113 [Trichinella sp. T6]